MCTSGQTHTKHADCENKYGALLYQNLQSVVNLHVPPPPPVNHENNYVTGKMSANNFG